MQAKSRHITQTLNNLNNLIVLTGWVHLVLICLQCYLSISIFNHS